MTDNPYTFLASRSANPCDNSKQAEKGNTTLKPLKQTGELHGRRGEDQGPEVVPGQQQQQPAWLNSSSIKVCFPKGDHL